MGYTAPAPNWGIPFDPIATPNSTAPHTVLIPPRSTDPLTQEYLYVGLWRSAFDLRPLDPFVVNFFDFSQEPDHEWIELINIAEGGDPIDLGGWEIQVGESREDSENHILTIPAGTLIAPGGMRTASSA